MNSSPFWAKPRNVYLILGLYFLAHFIVRLWIGPILGMDDAEQALFAQHWAWIYRFRAPPLFTWTLVGLSSFTGLNILTISLLRYIFLGLGAVALYESARRMINDNRLAALSVYSFASIHIFGYYSHHDLTHTTAMASLLAISWYAFIRLYETRQISWYIAFGVACGLGLLSKWNFGLWPLALIFTCIVRPTERPLIATWKSLAALIPLFLIPLPSLLRAWSMGPVEADGLNELIFTLPHTSFAFKLLYGSWKLILAIVVYPQPFLILFLACFAGVFWKGLKMASWSRTSSSSLEEILVWAIGLALVLHVLLIPVLGVSEFKARLMQPALMCLPLLLFTILDRGKPSPKNIRIFSILLLSITIIILGTRIGLQFTKDCGTCRTSTPFAALAQQLRNLGYTGKGTIIVGEFHTGGNIKVQFPQARVIYSGYSPVIWPAPSSDQGPCLLLWRADRGDDGEAGISGLEAYLKDNLNKGSLPLSQGQEGVVAEPLPRYAKKNVVLRYKLFPNGVGECH